MRQGIQILRLIAVLSLIVWLPSLAQETQFGEHESVAKSDAMTFASVFEAALANSPALIATESRQQQARNYAEIGNSWVPGRQSLELNYIDDSVIDDIGLREIESGIRFNLWRLGEREEAKRLGQSYGAQLDAWLGYQHLVITGRVRSVFAKLAEAETILAFELQATQDAEQLLEVTTRLFESGAVAQLDMLQAESLLLQQRRLELNAEAGLVDAEREYSVLTNLSMRPGAPYSEIQSTQTEIQFDHPVLRYLQAEIELASRNIDKVRREAGNRPSMTVGVRRERGDRLNPFTDSLGVSVSIPLGGKAAVSARVGDAHREKVDAEIGLIERRIRMNTELHEVEHEIFLADGSLRLSESETELNRQRYEMALIAFETGETDLSQTIVVLQQAHTSEKETERLQLERLRLISEYNQIIGIIP